MTNIVESFKKINSNIKKLNPNKLVNIIAISKTFSLDYIKKKIIILDCIWLVGFKAIKLKKL